MNKPGINAINMIEMEARKGPNSFTLLKGKTADLALQIIRLPGERWASVCACWQNRNLRISHSYYS